MRTSLIVLILLFGWLETGYAQLELPSTPEPREWIHDGENLISAEDRQKISQLQAEAFDKFNTPIVVVTIGSIRDFGATFESVEIVAQRLFDKWQIGKRDENNNVINRGILLLVCRLDRKARIELGDDWGRDWDTHCQEIMQNSIVRNFKKEKYSKGILAGVKDLAKMARRDPEDSPPFSMSLNLNKPMLKGLNPMPIWIGLLLIAAGIGLITAGIFVEKHRKFLVIAGILLILFAMLFYVMLFVLSWFLPGRGRRGWGGGGGGWSGGGGFSSGGFSGGGGATGSW